MKRPSALSPPIMPFTGSSCSRRPTPPRPNQHPSDTPGVFRNTNIHAFICVDDYSSCTLYTHTQSHTCTCYFLSSVQFTSVTAALYGDICQSSACSYKESDLKYLIQTNSSSPFFNSPPHRCADVSLLVPESSRFLALLS